jgi:hypothetical protein
MIGRTWLVHESGSFRDKECEGVPMNRLLLLGSVSLILCSCQMSAERTSLPPPPLPEKITALPYAELLTRARTQATLANEASYVDRWGELEDLAKGLEQTAQYMARANDVPLKHKDTLAVMSSDLGKAATQLREAAATKNAKKATVSLQRINLKVRELRLGD